MTRIVKVAGWKRECEKTVYLRWKEFGIWRQTQDRQPVWEYDQIDKAEHAHCVVTRVGYGSTT